MEFKISWLLPYGLLGTAIIFLFVIIGRNAVNIPIGDDFYCALLFVQQFQDSPDYFEKLSLLFGQWVEHRIVYSRLISRGFSHWSQGQSQKEGVVWLGITFFLFMTALAIAYSGTSSNVMTTLSSRNHRWLIYRHTSYFERSAQVASDFVRKQLRPAFTFAPVFPQLTSTALSVAPVVQARISWKSDFNRKKRLTIQSDCYPGSHGPSGEVYLIIYNDSECFLLPASPLRNGRKNMVVQWEYFKPGFFAFSMIRWKK